MLQALFQQIVWTRPVLFESAGIKIAKHVRPEAVECMKEWRLDISKHTPRHVSDCKLFEYSQIICIDENDAEYLKWMLYLPTPIIVVSTIKNIPDPIGKGMDAYKECAV